MEKSTKKRPDSVRIGSILIKSDAFNEEEEEEDSRSSIATTSTALSSSQRIQLPSSVFASNYEEETGYFNQAAPDHDPKVNWDPDIVKILDDDEHVNFEDEENEMDDDFFQIANSKTSIKSKNEVCDDDEDTETEEDHESGSDSGSGQFSDGENYSESESVKDFETKSKFTSYSMSSSVCRRNDGLRGLDDQFEKLFEEYDEDQIGSLDTEEIDGYRQNIDLVLEQALAEHTQLNKINIYSPEVRVKKSKNSLDILVEKSHKEEEEDEEEEEEDGFDSDSDTLSEQSENENKKEYETLHYISKKGKEERFDCESIVSTYSTLYNHPAIISEKKKQPTIQLSKKTGLPLGILNEKPLTQKKLDSIDHKITRILPEIPARTKEETKEEKKLRKNTVKEHRAQRRVEKKINKLAFKHEAAIQLKQKANNPSEGLVHLPL
jgi:protein LTV1